ncbi:unnamed protein product [Oikopleura dioica]|uniref:Heparan-sulfate 6-O-sulfotransferase n=1 Tax=Oikopleura dioica TaxID=34765 RepID=E4YG00_OIKDI|nr:unnamed protein product [Oikopleura dioica]
MSKAKISLFACLFITAALILFYANGSIELKVSEVKSVEKVVDPEIIENFELKTWNRSKSIGFLHCGKCGGTSMDRTLSPIVKSLSERKDDKYIGNMHYDWSYFELFEKDSVEPIILLRDPISRSVSNYHFKKTIPGVANSKQPTYVKFMASSFDTFLEQPEVMVDFAHLWIDSFAGLSMIDGLMSDDYYGTSTRKIYKDDRAKMQQIFWERELMRLNATWSLNLAADRLEKMGWFGILEKLEDSEILLSKYIGKTIKLSHANKTPNRTGHENFASEQVLHKLNALKPMNLWLYEFANRLFDARVSFLKTGVYQRPERKPMPEMSCTCTRLIIYCPGGELDFWVSKEAPAGYEESFWNYLQQLGVKIPNKTGSTFQLEFPTF